MRPGGRSAVETAFPLAEPLLCGRCAKQPQGSTPAEGRAESVPEAGGTGAAAVATPTTPPAGHAADSPANRRPRPEGIVGRADSPTANAAGAEVFRGDRRGAAAPPRQPAVIPGVCWLAPLSRVRRARRRRVRNLAEQPRERSGEPVQRASRSATVGGSDAREAGAATDPRQRPVGGRGPPVGGIRAGDPLCCALARRRLPSDHVRLEHGRAGSARSYRHCLPLDCRGLPL